MWAGSLPLTEPSKEPVPTKPTMASPGIARPSPACNNPHPSSSGSPAGGRSCPAPCCALQQTSSATPGHEQLAWGSRRLGVSQHIWCLQGRGTHSSRASNYTGLLPTLCCWGAPPPGSLLGGGDSQFLPWPAEGARGHAGQHPQASRLGGRNSFAHFMMVNNQNIAGHHTPQVTTLAKPLLAGGGSLRGSWQNEGGALPRSGEEGHCPGV